MAGFLSAHGYNPGPTQRPMTAGAICGVLAALPAVAVLSLFGSLEIEARILSMSIPATLGIGFVTMAIAGAAYGRIFGRAANDRRGGWLFGMAFGFALWAAGAVLVLPIASGGQTPAGPAAVGVCLSLMVWGCGLGLLIPFIHPFLHERIETVRSTELGPNAAASKSPRRTPQGPAPKR
ncbi:MAG TPA: hypothetical protein VNS53_04260 [Sphingomicrobium sp.]|jgi:hypothetical protein|nr:hypothetical protein [Sphingomicrobium sp.]